MKRLTARRVSPGHNSYPCHWLGTQCDNSSASPCQEAQQRGRPLHDSPLPKESITQSVATMHAQSGEPPGFYVLCHSRYSTLIFLRHTRYPAGSNSMLERTMKVNAIRMHEYGGPEVLQFDEIDLGPPAEGEAQIRHTAIGSARRANIAQRAEPMARVRIVSRRDAPSGCHALRVQPLHNSLNPSNLPCWTTSLR